MRNKKASTSPTLQRLRKLREKRDGEGKFSEKDDRELSNLEVEWKAMQLASFAMPTCCVSARRYPAAVYYVRTLEVEDTSTAEGKWHASLHKEISQTIRDLEDYRSGRTYAWFDEMPEPLCCTWCTTPLPKMRRKANPPPDVRKITDGGYYCDTCQERLSECECLPIEAAFEQVPRD